MFVHLKEHKLNRKCVILFCIIMKEEMIDYTFMGGNLCRDIYTCLKPKYHEGIPLNLE